VKLDIMKEALMKKMKSYGDEAKEGDALVDATGVKKDSDLAPDFKKDGEEGEDEQEGAELELPADGIVIEGKEHEANEENLLRQILQALSGGGALQGREGLSLSERAGVGANLPLAEMDALKKK